jgi:hypothetical protein
MSPEVVDAGSEFEGNENDTVSAPSSSSNSDVPSSVAAPIDDSSSDIVEVDKTTFK